jgi:hypothetical protein
MESKSFAGFADLAMLKYRSANAELPPLFHHAMEERLPSWTLGS